MNWIERVRWQAAAKQIARTLPAELSAGWGRSDVYTAGQIRAAFKKLRVADRYKPIAFARFLDEAAFEALDDATERSISYGVARGLFERFRRRSDISYAFENSDNPGLIVEGGGVHHSA